MYLNRGGHDPYKIYAAYAEAVATEGRPTVVLAMTVKGYGTGEAGEANNETHSLKKLDMESLKAFRDRFEIPIRDFSLSVSQILETGKGLIQVIATEVVAEFFKPCTHRATATELAQRDPVVAEAHRLGIHDFISEAVFEDTVLMNPRLVGKRIRSHNRLVGLHHHAGEI